MSKEKVGKGFSVRLTEDLEKKVLEEAKVNDRGAGYVIRKRLEYSYKHLKKLK